MKIMYQIKLNCMSKNVLICIIILLKDFFQHLKKCQIDCWCRLEMIIAKCNKIVKLKAPSHCTGRCKEDTKRKKILPSVEKGYVSDVYS